MSFETNHTPDAMGETTAMTATHLTHAQQGIYIDCTFEPNSLRYNIPKAYHFPEGIKPEAVREALQRVLNCHPAIFSHFEDIDGEAVQMYADHCEAELAVTKVSDEEVEPRKKSFAKPFDLAHGPLFRAEILAAPSATVLLLDFHHLVYDGFSNITLINQLCAALEGIEPIAEQSTYADFAKAQESSTTDHKAYYDKLFAGGTQCVKVPGDLNGEGGEHAEHTIAVSAADVMARAKAMGTAPSALFMAAAFYTLSRYTNSSELCMTTISNGRRNPLSQGVVGMFVNTIPLVTKIEDVSIREFVGSVRKMFVEIRQHEEYPFASIVSDYGVEQTVRFTYQYGTTNVRFRLNGEEICPERLRLNSQASPMTITICGIGDTPAITINYDTATYSEEFVSRFAESMDAVVAHFLAAPDCRLLATSIMSDRQQQEASVLHQTCLDPSAVRFPLFHSSIEYWAEHTPDKTAIIACNETLSYRQFNEKANVLAHALINKGVVPGDRICLLLPRKSWHLIAMFGVMKAGAAYIPCDPEYPAERISLITEDSHARYVITTSDKMEPYGTRALNIETLLSSVCPTTNPTDIFDKDGNYITPPSLPLEGGPRGVTPLAYLIYTSGSTGRPKGVMLRHIGICNYLTAHEENRHIYAMANDCKAMLSITTVSFDLSLKELGASLFNGLTLVLADEEQVNDPQALAELMLATGADGLSGTPSRLKMFLDLPDFQKALSNCKYIVLGGEKYPPTLLPQIKALAPDSRLFNTYGPTEISVSSNCKELTHADHITIGRPLLNVNEYVVDNDLNELPVGVTGELLIGGLGVSVGYNDLPEKTAEAFIDYNGERCYKSGDYAYWNADGDVIILGRKDHQIKLNGLRIELGEVETVLNRQPQVKEGVVMIKTVNGNDHLVAYFVANDNATVGDVPTSSPTTVHEDLTTALKEQMATSLTDYMVPTIFMQMDKMPISPNGKTDLKALPEPVMMEEGTDDAAPRELNILEKKLSGLVAEILETDNVSVTTPLRRSGLTSLLSIKLAAHLYREYGVKFKVKEISAGNILDIENEILACWMRKAVNSEQLTVNNGQFAVNSGQLTVNSEQLTVNNGGKADPDPTPTLPSREGVQPTTPNLTPNTQHPSSPLGGNEGGLTPLSYPQQGVYLDIMRNPDSVQYNMPKCLEFPAEYTTEAIAEAVRQMISNHPILSAHFESDGDTVMQVIPETVEPQVTVSTDDVEQLKADFIRPFDLEHGPLYRATVAGSTLLFDVLHLVNDGFSNGILMSEICKALQGDRLTPEVYTYANYVADEQQARQGKEFAESKAFFAERMKTIDEASSIQADVNSGEDYKGRLCFASTPVDMMAVKAFAQKLDITPAALFLAAANYTVARYTNNNDVCLATISNGRSNVLVNDTVGMFVNTLALTSHLKEQTVEQFIIDTANEYSLTLEHENYPFAELSAEYDFHPDVFYQYQIGVRSTLAVGGKRVAVSSFGATDPKFKMIISIEEDSNREVRIEMQYNDAFYSYDLAQGMAQSMANVLRNMMADTSASVRKVSMLNDEQRTQIATFHDGPKVDVPIKLYHKLLEASVEAHPDALALVAVDQQLTYREMNAQMNRIAHSLIARGIKRGDRIALLLPRTSRLILSQYGVLKAGGAYIPCDPKYPTERINHILDDSAAPLIITTSDRLAEFPGRSVDVEELLRMENGKRKTDNSTSSILHSPFENFPGRSVDVEELLRMENGKLKTDNSTSSILHSPFEDNPDIHVEPDDLAYLIYTSGSTGVPKGVQLMHKGVCNYHCPANLIQSMLNSECHAALGITTISFDMSVWETGSPLMLGKTLVLASDDQCNDPLALAGLISKYDIGCMTATTSRFMQLLESEEFEAAFKAHIRMAYQGGEALSPALLTKLQGYGVRIVNGYGPTETIANSHASELTAGNIPHIGKPCCNYCNYIVDNDGNELPVGVVGELLIGGDSVAKGYNNLPEQTAARFTLNPYLPEEQIVNCKSSNCKIYHSGDYARWLPDGNVMVLGRKDNQVKLRGLRIELGEVESAMVKVEGIKNTVVMIKKLQGRDHLCAYFTADRPIDIDHLKSELKKTLTHYMIPTAYLQMDQFPLTPNGKTNTKALPDPVVSVAPTEYVAAANKTEQDFCDIFADVLQLDNVGATDNFFEIGGTSLVAMRVVMKAVKLGYQIVYKDVFERPTARALAELSGDILQDLPPAPSFQDGEKNAQSDNVNAPHSDNPEIHDYDYTAIDALLQSNVIANIPAADVANNLRPLGACVVTGATGYLGIHVVKELIDREDVPAIYCMVRGTKTMSAESRLRTQLFYYFDDSYEALFGKRIFVIEGDVTKPECLDSLVEVFSPRPERKGLGEGPGEGPVSTLFNCATNVKHFSAGTDIEDINIGGCQTCIDFCLKTGARLIQTSTHSIEGRMISDTPVTPQTLTESKLYMGQTQSGQYTSSKFIAERNVLEAVATKGLDAKIMRYGNLAARSTDGEFQINFSSNGFMNRLNVYKTLGAIPYSKSASLTEFSPINEVARATVLLATTPRQFTVFMPINSHHEPMSDIIICMRRLGFHIKDVEQSEFDDIVMEAGQDPQKAAIIQSLLAYAPNIRGKHFAYNDRNNSFTTQMLMRLGFNWSFTTWDYMEQMITAIQGLGFFDDDYRR